MKRFNKTIAVLCSATMILGSSLTAFAEAPSSTAGTGNMLAYDYDTIVVPTAIKVTFNPQGLAIKTGGTADAPVTSTDKVVSLGYGIASKASTPKKVVVKFAANFVQSGEEESDVVFVDAATKVAAKTGAEDTVGAPDGSHKIYLYVAPATAQPTINDGTNEGTGTPFAVTGADGSKTDNATAVNLANVKMTPATAGLAVFATASGDDVTPKNDAYANIGFKLTQATYSLKTAGSVDFDTTQSELADLMEMSALGQVTGFTIKGDMNTNTDWTKANISAINITPIYTVAAAGAEEAVTGTEGVITLEATADTAEPDKPAASEAAATPTMTMQTNGNLTYTFEESGRPTGTLTAIKINGTGRQGQITNGNITYNATNGFFKITAAAIEAIGGVTEGNTTIVATIGGKDYTLAY